MSADRPLAFVPQALRPSLIGSLLRPFSPAARVRLHHWKAQADREGLRAIARLHQCLANTLKSAATNPATRAAAHDAMLYVIGHALNSEAYEDVCRWLVVVGPAILSLKRGRQDGVSGRRARPLWMRRCETSKATSEVAMTDIGIEEE